MPRTHAGPVTFLHFAPTPEQRDLSRRARADRRRSSQRSPGSFLHAGAGGGGGGRPLQPGPTHAGASPNTRWPRHSPAARPRFSTQSARHGRRRAWSRASTSRASFPRRLHRRVSVAGGLVYFVRLRPAARKQRRFPARAGRGRRAHARDRMSHGHLPHVQLPEDGGHGQEPRTGEVSSNEDEEIQICVSAPIGDVVVGL